MSNIVTRQVLIEKIPFKVIFNKNYNTGINYPIGTTFYVTYHHHKRYYEIVRHSDNEHELRGVIERDRFELVKNKNK